MTIPRKTIDSKGYEGDYRPSFLSIYHVQRSDIYIDSRRKLGKKGTPSMTTVRNGRTSKKHVGKKAKRKNGPKNSAKKTRDFFLLMRLAFFSMNECMKFVLYFSLPLFVSLFLSLFLSFSYRQNACVQARSFVLYIQ
jgi:hypothetical protein